MQLLRHVSRLVALTVGALLLPLLATVAAQAQEKKPNILVIWGDDIGTWNISHNNKGMMGYQTPNIDRIAREHGLSLIADAEAKTKTLGHPVTDTTSPSVLVGPKTRTRRDTWNDGLGHAVTMAEKGAKPMPARVSGEFGPAPEKPSHRTPDVPPLYVAIPTGDGEGVKGKGRAPTKPRAARAGHLKTEGFSAVA